MATYIEQSLAKLKEFEGCVPWMYRDTVGKVTVGVGLMLPTAAAATALPFALLGTAASSAAITADFKRVSAMVEGRSAAFYRSSSSPLMAPEMIDAQLLAVLKGFEGRLRDSLHGYDTFPAAVKLALLDMTYNLGPAGLLAGYPRMLSAVKQGHWALAATECLRHGPSALRNAWTRDQFLAAVIGTIQAEAETWLARMGRRSRSLWSRLTSHLWQP
jgi:GH24 family phage-related lysozyme (muramidase)